MLNKIAQSGSGKKVANSLVAASAAAVLAVYTAGYARTRSAADQLDAQSAERRPVSPEGRGSGRSAAAPSRPATSAGNTDTPAAAAPVYDWASDQGNAPAPTAAPRAEPAPAIAPAVAVPVSTPAASPVAATRTVEPAAPQLSHKPEPAAAAPAASANAAPVVAALTPAPAAVAAPPPAAAPAPVASLQPAPAAPAPPAAAPSASPAPAKYKDGTYTGWGTSRHGDIQAEVVIEGGRITVARIAQCLTRYSCNVIGPLPPEVPQRQSAEVDYVSGATQSTNAFYYAVVEALGKAK